MVSYQNHVHAKWRNVNGDRTGDRSTIRKRQRTGRHLLYTVGGGLHAILAGEYLPDGVHRLSGAQYQNLRVQLIPGAPVCNVQHADGSTPSGEGSTIPLATKNGLGFQPDETDEGEPVELSRRDGQFFTQPFENCPVSSTTCPAEFHIPISSDQVYEKITTTFDFTTDDLLLEGRWQWLARLENACTNQYLWHFFVKHPDPLVGTQGLTAFNARGHNPRVVGELNYQANTQYRAEIVMDFKDEETYTKIYDAAGNLLHIVGDKMNTDPTNTAAAAATHDGFNLVFGLYREFNRRITGQPHFWKFSNLIVTGVPVRASVDGEDPLPGPEDADLTTDEGRLAFLAAQLLAIAEGEYTLDCGPAEEVLNIPPSGSHPDNFCVLKDERQVIIGTFGTNGESELLDAFKDDLFNLDVTDVDNTACDDINVLDFEFQECDDAVENRRTYAANNIDTSTSFVIVGERTIDAFDTTILESIAGFFKNIFGLGEENTVGMTEIPLRRFHHGYFASIDDRNLAATWNDDAVLFYRGFSTDFNLSRPKDSDYFLGNEKQVVAVDLRPSNEHDVALWRRLTAALRIKGVGTPLAGDTCGNGIQGFDEDCDTAEPLGSCEELYDSAFGVGDVTCNPNTCLLDFSGCSAPPVQEGCFDEWVQPPSPNPCAEPGRDPACDRLKTGGPGPSDPDAPTCRTETVCETAPDDYITVQPPETCPAGYEEIPLDENIDIPEVDIEIPVNVLVCFKAGGEECTEREVCDDPGVDPSDLSCGQLWVYHGCNQNLIQDDSCGCVGAFTNGVDLGPSNDCRELTDPRVTGDCCLPTGTTYADVCSGPGVNPGDPSECTPDCLIGDSCATDDDCAGGGLTTFCSAQRTCQPMTLSELRTSENLNDDVDPRGERGTGIE